MGNRPMGYWICFLVAVGLAIAAFVMLRSHDSHTHEIARYMGWGAIALLLIARFAFRSKTAPEPPMPKD